MDSGDYDNCKLRDREHHEVIVALVLRYNGACGHYFDNLPGKVAQGSCHCW